MPGRKFTQPNSKYRYGFNGKELDKESSSTTTYDYGFRIYSPALGRFLSVDPLFKSYPELTPYQFASNSPIEAIDLDGLEAESSKKEGFLKSFGKSVLRGIGNTVSYVANNPNHAGYGNGVQPNTGKPPTPEDFKRYDFSIIQQFNPTYQIETFSNNLVYGTYNFVGGIIDGDGARTAQAIPPLLGSVGAVAGLRGLAVTKPMTVTRGMALAERMTARTNFVKAKWASSIEKYGPDHIDFTKPVSEVGNTGNLVNGKSLVQWREPGNPNASPFFSYDGVDPGTLGIPKTYTQKYFVELPGTQTFLESTANKVKAFSAKDPGVNGSYNGGGTQLYSPEAAKTATFIPAGN